MRACKSMHVTAISPPPAGAIVTSFAIAADLESWCHGAEGQNDSRDQSEVGVSIEPDCR